MFVSAFPKTSDDLGLLRVGLGMVASDQRLPDNLREYLEKTIEQAVEIIEKPNTISTRTSPDAIELAMQMLGDVSIKQVFVDLKSDSMRGAEKAKQILDKVEDKLAYIF